MTAPLTHAEADKKLADALKAVLARYGDYVPSPSGWADAQRLAVPYFFREHALPGDAVTALLRCWASGSYINGAGRFRRNVNGNHVEISCSMCDALFGFRISKDDHLQEWVGGSGDGWRNTSQIPVHQHVGRQR